MISTPLFHFNKLLLFVLLFTTTSSLFSQKRIGESKWKTKNIHPSKVPDSLSHLDAVSIKYDQVFLTYMDPYKGMMAKFTTNERFKIQTENGKDYCDKFSLYKPKNSKIIELDAITIKPNGEIVHFSTSDLKQVNQQIKYANNSFQLQTYKIAIPNVEIGDEVEIRYQIQMENIITSEDLYFNANFYCLKSTIKLQYEKNFLFDIRTFNNLNDPEYETTLYHKNYTWVKENVASFQNSNYSIPAFSEPFVSYAIRYYVTEDGQKHPILKNQWGDLYDGIFKYLSFNNLSMKDKKFLDNHLSTLKANNSELSNLKLLKLLSDSMNKMEITPAFIVDEKKSLIDHFSDGSITQEQIFSIYLVAMEKYKIPYEIGLLRNRYEGYLYNDFVSLTHIDDFILLPKNSEGASVYLYPSSSHTIYALNEFPYQYENTQVVLIDKSNANALKFSHRFETLPSSGINDNYVVHRYQIKFNYGDSIHSAVGQSKTSGTLRAINQNDTTYLNQAPIHFDSLTTVSKSNQQNNYPYKTNFNVSGNCIMQSKEVNDSIFSLTLEPNLGHQYPDLSTGTKRMLPFFGPFPYSENIQYAITFPFPVKLLTESKYVDGNFNFMVTQQSPNVIFVNSKFKFSNTFIPAESYDNYVQQIENHKMEKNAPIVLQKM